MEWVCAPNPWSLADGFLDCVAYDEAQEPQEQLVAPVVEHEEVELRMPQHHVALSAEEVRKAPYVVQFDGEAVIAPSGKGKTGTGGVLVWGPQAVIKT